MSSDDSDPQPDTSLASLLGSIAADAKSIETKEEVSSLKERIDSLELLVEEFGQARELQNELQGYLSDLRQEARDIRNYRFWLTTASSLMSVILFALLFFCMVSRPDWFIMLDGSLQVPLILALGAASVFLMSLMLRGVYRSRHERHQGEMLPEAVKVALEALRQS